MNENNCERTLSRAAIEPARPAEQLFAERQEMMKNKQFNRTAAKRDEGERWAELGWTGLRWAGRVEMMRITPNSYKSRAFE